MYIDRNVASSRRERKEIPSFPPEPPTATLTFPSRQDPNRQHDMTPKPPAPTFTPNRTLSTFFPRQLSLLDLLASLFASDPQLLRHGDDASYVALLHETSVCLGSQYKERRWEESEPLEVRMIDVSAFASTLIITCLTSLRIVYTRSSTKPSLLSSPPVEVALRTSSRTASPPPPTATLRTTLNDLASTSSSSTPITTSSSCRNGSCSSLGKPSPRVSAHRTRLES
jgi:hypothetical protein